MSSAREAAVGAILAIAGGEHAQAAINKSAALLPIQERPFHVELVYGTLRSKIRLDFILRAVLKNPAKLPPAMRIALELAAYSLLFQSGSPAYAVINETVKLVKKKFGQCMANVANGALRSLERIGEAALEREWGGASQAVFYALPEPIYDLWIEAYGDDGAAALARRSFARPWTGMRANLAHPNGQSILAALLESGGERIGLAGVAFAPGKTPAIILGKSFTQWQSEGAVSYQAAGSMLVLEELGLYESWRGAPVWDACSGRGGKTMALLERGIAAQLASDSNFGRLRELSGEAARLGLPRPQAVAASAAAPLAPQWQGHIIADAPCSGLGVIGRRPDIKARWSQAGTANIVDLQARILDNLAASLKPGRELAYITCSLNPAENEQQIQALLKRQSDIELVKQWQTPIEHEWLEGMYGARLIKRDK